MTEGSPSRASRYRASEIVLILASAAVFAVTAYAYVTDWSVWRHWLGLPEQDVSAPIGRLALEESAVRRRLAREADFRAIDASAPLYNQDTIVTDARGGATVAFLDGSQLELGPATLVRLSYVSELSLAGVIRSTQIEVVTGQARARSSEGASGKLILKTPGKAPVVVKSSAGESVAAEAPPVALASLPIVAESEPSPRPVESATPQSSPEPLAASFELLEHPPEDAEVVGGRDTGRVGVAIRFRWKGEPAHEAVVSILAPGERDPDELKVSASPDGHALLEYVAARPGKYRWSVAGKRIPPFEPRSFTVARRFPGAPVPRVLIDGKRVSSSEYRGEPLTRFVFNFEWASVPRARSYRVLVLPRGAQASVTLETEEPRADWNPEGTAADQFRYQLVARFKNGFEQVSAESEFGFSYVAPVPTAPVGGREVKLATIREEGALLAWKKTNFTQAYEVELARDVDFKQGLRRFRPKQNFVVVPGLAPGVYFWRVRGLGATSGGSPFSATQTFGVTD